MRARFSALMVLAVAASSTLSDLGDFLRDLDHSAQRWIRAAPDARARDRRRLVSASVALETAYVNRDRWRDARHLVEWGCVLQRSAFTSVSPESRPAPSAAYRFWQRGARRGTAPARAI
jgi:hypothetical protein